MQPLYFYVCMLSLDKSHGNEGGRTVIGTQGPFVVIEFNENMLLWVSQLIMCTHRRPPPGGSVKISMIHNTIINTQ